MGTVFRAHDRYSGQVVALKLMHSTRALMSEAERFTREAQVLATLHHPNIVSYVAHGQTSEGQQYLALEWLDGEDLARRLTRKVLSFSEALTLLRRVASALAAAHRKGIVHRDIKPSNLFLRNDDADRVTLIDFGIARRALPDKPITKTGFSIGTPAYMAPEQARGEREITAAADVFSLGCVIYECLTGEPLYLGEYSISKEGGISYEEGAPIRALLPSIPESFAALLDRMYNKVVAERPQNGGALLEEIEALDEGGMSAQDSVMVVSTAPQLGAPALDERRLAILILAVPRADAMLDEAKTMELSRAVHLEEMTTGVTKPTLQRVIRRFGAQAKWLSDGSLIAGMNQAASPKDLVMHCAQCALSLRALWPGAQISMVAGFSDTSLMDSKSDLWRRILSMTNGAESTEALDPATVGEIFLDEFSAALLSVDFSIERRGDRLLLGHRRIDTNDVRPLCGIVTSCVGRERELGELDAAFAECTEDEIAQALVVLGPSGCGKSRLRQEFLNRLQARDTDMTLLMGTGVAISSSAPYTLIGQLLERLVRTATTEQIQDEEALRQKLHERLKRNLPAQDVQQVLKFLSEICRFSLSGDSNPPSKEDSEATRLLHEGIVQAFIRFLAAECSERPVLLVLDDLQWVDAASLQLLDSALRELKNQPFLLLAFGSSEVLGQTPELWTGRKLQILELSGLSKKASENLVRQVLGSKISEASLSRIFRLSRGNALTLEELIQNQADANSSWLSEMLLALGHAALMRLEPDARRILRVASAFGPTFWSQGLIVVLGVKDRPEEAMVWLKSLVDAEIIECQAESSIPGEQEYGWPQELLRDAAENTLLNRDRPLVYHAVASWLAQVGAYERAALVKATGEQTMTTTASVHLVLSPNDLAS